MMMPQVVMKEKTLKSPADKTMLCTTDEEVCSLFERYVDPSSGRAFRDQMKEKIRQFMVEIQKRHGYTTAPKVTYTENLDMYQIDIVQVGMAYAFYVTNFDITYHEYRQIV